MSIFSRILGTSNDKALKRLTGIVAATNAHEPGIRQMSDSQLREQTRLFRGRLDRGEPLDDLMPEAFAVVREATVRTLDKRHFDEQIIGGAVLHQGRIAEMKTGEGKTQTAALAAYLNGLTGKGVHIVTVNDYLARFHSEWMGKIYRFLGLTVGLIAHDMTPAERKHSYGCDITYGTNNELGFDYLRDNMVIYKKDMVHRALQYAIIDEVDSILIDEARTPLIISGAGDKSTQMYIQVDRFVSRLKPDADYEKDEKERSVTLTAAGVAKAEQHFNVENLSDLDNTELNHHVNQALRARVLMKRDKDYVVQNGQVIIVDEFTGRLMTGRRYSEGLHQAIEAKENVQVERESKTLATITFQNYFRMYHKLAGMTGTAKTEESEFQAIYSLDVVTIPTHKPMIRKDHNDVVYRSVKGKFDAVVEDAVTRHKQGQPVLVGTVSVEKSEYVSDLLTHRGVPHQVLNAKNHAKEAQIVAQAGQINAVTIATNMAGRGTDILLGGNAEFIARQEMRQMDYPESLIEEAIGHQETRDQEILDARKKFNELYEKHRAVCDAEHEQVVALGGLHIIGTERHESRRIDNQLRGRSGRQGDPGSSRFYISLEDDLMRLFGSDRISGMVERLGLEEDQPIEYGLLSKQIESAQKRIEGKNFDVRRHVLQYDDVMNQQRELIYSQRRMVLDGESVHQSLLDMIPPILERAIEQHCGAQNPEDWDIQSLLDQLEHVVLPQGAVAYTPEQIDVLTHKKLQQELLDAMMQAYDDKCRLITDAGVAVDDVERVVLLRVVDENWMDHIDAMDQLRQGIGLRAYGQRDPVVEYKMEGYDMFESMISTIQQEALRMMMRVNLERVPERAAVAQPTMAVHGDMEQRRAPATAEAKVGRNSPCPCGSGKKYKNCCGA